MTDLAAVKPEHNKPVVNLTYFLELHRGWYEPGLPGEPGAYHVAEKSRSGGAADAERLPLTYLDADGGGYWRECARQRDPAYLASPSAGQGMDFAWADASPTFWGLGHHSQFKCLVVKDSPPAVRPATGGATSAANAADSPYRFNTCEVKGAQGPDAAWDPLNPSQPAWACSAVDYAIAEGVVWAAVRYQDYVGAQPYRLGCGNECTESSASCPGCPQTHEDCPGTATPGASCIGKPDEFGKLFCGCTIGFGGRSCEVACSGRDPRSPGFDPASEHTRLSLQADYALTPRKGYWLCGGVTQTTYETAAEPMLRQAGAGYRLRGEVGLLQRVTGDPMCEGDGSGGCKAGGYRLR